MEEPANRGLVLLGNRQAEVQQFARPDPGPGEVVIRVKAAGICGSDLHFYRSTPGELGLRRGVVIGHEPSGVIELIGRQVNHLKPGDRVTVNHTLGCGRCEYCVSGHTVRCSENLGIAASGYGGDAEFIRMPATACLPLPTELSHIEGAFIACTGATAYAALRKLSPSGHDHLVVFGLGPVGLSGVVVAKALGATVIGVDLIPERLSLARELGADETINAAETDAVPAIRALTSGRGAELAFETSGSSIGQSNAVDCVCPHGKAAFVGLGKGQKSISPEQFLHKEAVLFGSKVMPTGMYWEMTRFLLEQDVRFEPIVTHRVTLDQAPAAFASFDNGAAGKFVIVMD